MANMNYCRFENTYNDLDECFEALGEESIDELSDSERKYALKMIRLCASVIEDFEYLLNEK